MKKVLIAAVFALSFSHDSFAEVKPFLRCEHSNGSDHKLTVTLGHEYQGLARKLTATVQEESASRVELNRQYNLKQLRTAQVVGTPHYYVGKNIEFVAYSGSRMQTAQFPGYLYIHTEDREIKQRMVCEELR
ncbi:MAG: hypothetical protein A3K03_05565 [Bdellovibrionales bacterium RIFOXYD1_FULL_44_7]|nr:MAG: hypothetical protein A3K03_05565 [Bdellovibrionales bacterium RIFOXYD1_FULL_44_7]